MNSNSPAGLELVGWLANSFGLEQEERRWKDAGWPADEVCRPFPVIPGQISG